MAKELPYFRFTPQEWQNGDISLESYAVKGLYIDICAYYWVQDCVVTKKMLVKKFRNARKNLQELIELGILKHDHSTDEVVILYLNTQYDLLSKNRIDKQKAGRSGGLKKSSNAKAELKQKPSYKDKDKDNNNDKDKDNLEKRKLKFSSTLEPYESIYGRPLLKEFNSYWTEPNKSNTKFKQELEKTWSLERRLSTWAKNDKNFNNGKSTKQFETANDRNKRASDERKERLGKELLRELHPDASETDIESLYIEYKNDPNNIQSN